LEQLKNVGVDGWPSGLHQVEGEGVTVAVVGVDDAQARVEPEGEAGDACLGFEDRV
jgi:hypothetical protein